MFTVLKPPWASRLRHSLSLEKEFELMLTEFTISPIGKWYLEFLVGDPKLSFETVVLNLVDSKM